MKENILIALRGPNTRQKNPPNQSIPDNLFDLPLNYQVGAGDTYFSGKMIARLARLIAIADELGEPLSEKAESHCKMSLQSTCRIYP